MEIVTERRDRGAVGDGRVTEVLLRDGRALPADIFLVARRDHAERRARARRRARRRHAACSSTTRMRTSDPAIFAAGDVAEHRGRVHGLWPAAVEQAEVAAEQRARRRQGLRAASVPVTILKVVGIELTSIGRFEPERARRGGHRARGRARPAATASS